MDMLSYTDVIQVMTNTLVNIEADDTTVEIRDAKLELVDFMVDQLLNVKVYYR